MHQRRILWIKYLQQLKIQILYVCCPPCLSPLIICWKYTLNRKGGSVPSRRYSIWETAVNPFYVNGLQFFQCFPVFYRFNIRDNIFKNGPGKICGRQALKIWTHIVCSNRTYHLKFLKVVYLLHSFVETLHHWPLTGF